MMMVKKDSHNYGPFLNNSLHMLHRLPKVSLNMFDGFNPTRWVIKWNTTFPSKLYRITYWNLEWEFYIWIGNASNCGNGIRNHITDTLHGSSLWNPFLLALKRIIILWNHYQITSSKNNKRIHWCFWAQGNMDKKFHWWIFEAMFC